MNMVIPALRHVRPTIVVTAIFKALPLAPNALPFHLLVEIKFHVFESVALFQVIAAWVDIQVIFLTMKHEPFNALPASVTPYSAFWVARFWGISHEPEPRAREKFMRN